MTILARGEGLAGFRSLPSVSWEARVALFCSVISVLWPKWLQLLAAWNQSRL